MVMSKHFFHCKKNLNHAIDEVSSFKKQHNELKKGHDRGLKGLSSVWGPALPSVIAILFP